MRTSSAALAWRGLFAVVGLFALGLQYWLAIAPAAPDQIPELTLNFFSYFTVLTNVIATLVLIFSLAPASSTPGRIARNPELRAAIAMYIAVVGVTYHFLLSHVWDPQGWLFVANGLLHYVMPIAFVLDWLLFVPKGQLRLAAPLKWLAFPLIYTGWTVIHGYASGWWPYWFMNVPALGVPKTAFWAAAMLVFFLGVGMLVVLLDGLLKPKTPAA